MNLMLHRLCDNEDPEAARETIDSASATILGIGEGDVEAAIEFALAEAAEIQI